MAISKRITLPNGISINYHRVTSVNTITNNQNIIEVTSYTSKAKREEEKAFYDKLEADRKALADAESVEDVARKTQSTAINAEQEARSAFETALETLDEKTKALSELEASEESDEEAVTAAKEAVTAAKEAVTASQDAYEKSRDESKAASTALGTAQQEVERLRMLNREWPQVFTETAYSTTPYDQTMTIAGAYEWIKANVPEFEGAADALD